MWKILEWLNCSVFEVNFIVLKKQLVNYLALIMFPYNEHLPAGKNDLLAWPAKRIFWQAVAGDTKLDVLAGKKFTL